MIDDYVTTYDTFLNKFMFTLQSRMILDKEINTDLSNNLSGQTTDSGWEVEFFISSDLLPTTDITSLAVH